MIESNVSTLKIERSSNRSFGAVFTIFLVIINSIFYFHYNIISPILIFFFIFFLTFTIFLPRYLYVLNKVWTKFGLMLGKITTPIIISLIYFISVAPFGILFRCINVDFLKQKYNKKQETYWINKKNNIGSFKDQY